MQYSRVGCAPLIMQVLEDVEGLSLYGYMDRIRTARSHSQFIAVVSILDRCVATPVTRADLADAILFTSSSSARIF